MREKEIKNVFEDIKAKKFSKLKKQVEQEEQRVPNEMNSSRPTPRHVIIKMTEVKERVLNRAREKKGSLQGNLCKGNS